MATTLLEQPPTASSSATASAASYPSPRLSTATAPKATALLNAIPVRAWTPESSRREDTAVDVRNLTTKQVLAMSLLKFIEAYERGEKTCLDDDPAAIADLFSQREGLNRILTSDTACRKFRHELPQLGADEAPDPVSDFATYMAALERGYRAIVDACADALPPMHRKCEASIVVPAALSQERDFLYRTIQSFAKQNLDFDRFEIVLLGNFTPEHAAGRRGLIFESMDEIARARRDFPHVRLQVVSTELIDKEVRTIGLLRSLPADLVMLRHMRRHTEADHIMIRCDADTRGVRPQYISGFLRQFEVNPHVDSIMGELVWSPERFAGNPLLLVNQVLHQMLDRFGWTRSGKFIWNGPNLAIRMSVYARIGGYDTRCTLGEDVELARRLYRARKDSTTRIPMAPGTAYSRLATSTRRADAALEESDEAHSARQWNIDTTEFGVDNEHVRTRSEKGTARRFTDTPELRGRIETLVRATMTDAQRTGWYGKITTADRPVARILTRVLGIKYEPNGETGITITDLSAFLERHDALCDGGVEQWFEGMNRGHRELEPPMLVVGKRSAAQLRALLLDAVDKAVANTSDGSRAGGSIHSVKVLAA